MTPTSLAVDSPVDHSVRALLYPVQTVELLHVPAPLQSGVVDGQRGGEHLGGRRDRRVFHVTPAVAR